MPRASPGARRAPSRLRTPGNAGERRSLGATIDDALPLLLRARVLDAVLAAQTEAAGPVTSQEARGAAGRPLLRHARAFTELAWRVTRLGPDERGRLLHGAGTSRKGLALWWVEERHGG